MKYKEQMFWEKTTNNQASISILPSVFVPLPKGENDPMVDTDSLVWGFGRKQQKTASSQKGVYPSKIVAQTRRLIIEPKPKLDIWRLIFDKYNIIWHI